MYEWLPHLLKEEAPPYQGRHIIMLISVSITYLWIFQAAIFSPSLHGISLGVYYRLYSGKCPGGNAEIPEGVLESSRIHG